MIIQRLNMDSSWLITWNGVTFMIDPWLIGTEIDGFSWLNEQWHVVEPIDIKAIKPYNAIIVSNPYSDHCHLETLRKLDTQVPILATKPSTKRLKKEWKEREVTPMGYANEGGFIDFKGFKIAALKPVNKWIDPIYHVILITHGKDAICYASHGFFPSAAQLELLKGFNIRLLMTTFTWFQIPKIMGGTVNPGFEAAQTLADQLGAKYLINTHDEQKKGKGLVLKLAKTKYQDLESVQDERFVHLAGYEESELA